MTEDTPRVIRPACESIYKVGTPSKNFGVFLTKYMLARPGVTLPMTVKEVITFCTDLAKSNEYQKMVYGVLGGRPSRHRTLLDTVSEGELAQLASQQVADYYGKMFMYAKHAALSYLTQKEEDRKVYLFSEEFFAHFYKVNPKNITGEHLPKTSCGCIVLPKRVPLSKNGGYDEILFYSGDLPEEIRLLQDAKKTPGEEDPDAIQNEMLRNRLLGVTDALDKTCITVIGINSAAQKPEFSMTINVPHKKKLVEHLEKSLEDMSAEDTAAVTLAFNLLVYANTGNPDIRPVRNTVRYRGKSTVNVHPEDADLTRSQVYLVGFGWLKDPQYVVAGWYSAGYMAWRLCGKGKTELRLVYFSPSFKQRRKGQEDVVTEEGASEEDFIECCGEPGEEVTNV